MSEVRSGDACEVDYGFEIDVQDCQRMRLGRARKLGPEDVRERRHLFNAFNGQARLEHVPSVDNASNRDGMINTAVLGQSKLEQSKIIIVADDIDLEKLHTPAIKACSKLFTSGSIDVAKHNIGAMFIENLYIASANA